MKLLALLLLAGLGTVPISAEKIPSAHGDKVVLSVIWMCGEAADAMGVVSDENRKSVIDVYTKLGCPAIQKAIGVSDPREDNQ